MGYEPSSKRPVQSSPIGMLNPFERQYFMSKQLNKTFSNKRDKDQVEFENNHVISKRENIKLDFYHTPLEKQHNKNIKPYLIPVRRFGLTDVSHMTVPAFGLVDDPELIRQIELNRLGDLYNRTMNSIGNPAGDGHGNDRDNHEITDEQRADQDDAGRQEHDGAVFIEEEQQFIEEEKQELEGIGEEAELGLVANIEAIVSDPAVFARVLSEIPRPTNSENQQTVFVIINSDMHLIRQLILQGDLTDRDVRTIRGKLARYRSLKTRKYKEWKIAVEQIYEDLLIKAQVQANKTTIPQQRNQENSIDQEETESVRQVGDADEEQLERTDSRKLNSRAMKRPGIPGTHPDAEDF